MFNPGVCAKQKKIKYKKKKIVEFLHQNTMKSHLYQTENQPTYLISSGSDDTYRKSEKWSESTGKE